jgi:hypothetical protein
MDFAGFTVGINELNPTQYGQSLVVTGNLLANTGHLLTTANLSFDLGNVTNQWRNVWAGNLYGAISTASQPNITSVGNLTQLTVTGLTTLSNTSISSNLTIAANSAINAGNNTISWVKSPVVGTDAATKAYVDNQFVIASNVAGNTIPLYTPTVNSGNLQANAAYLGFTVNTYVTDAIDILNSVAENLFTNTFVRSVTFSSNVTSGGAGQTILLTILAQGNANQYTINWGDGNTYTTTSSTCTHQYTTNVGTPFTVIVTATNTNGAGPSNSATTTNVGYINIYSANPGLNYNLYRTNTGGTILSGNNLYSIQGNVIYLQNTSTNTNAATVTWSVLWGDGSVSNIANNSANGGVLGGNLSYTYNGNSGTGQWGVNLALLTDNIANPAIIPIYSNVALKVYGNTVAPPSGVNTKLLSITNTSGTSPYLAYGFRDNTGGTTLTAGTSVNRISIASTALVGTAGNVTTAYSYTANVGYINAVINGAVAGNISLASQTTTTLSGNIGLSGIADFNLYTSAGASTTFALSTYYPGLYYGITANIQCPVVRLANGVSRFGINHTITGVTNNVDFVVDNVTSVPTVTAGYLSAATNGTYRYISGIPYYNSGSPTVSLANVTVSNLTGQTYYNGSPFTLSTGQFQEGTSSAITGTNTYTYTQVSNSSVGILNGSIPYANVGVGNVYTIASLSVPITASAVRSVANLVVYATNVNGNSPNVYNISNVQVHTAAQSGISEIAISANTSANTNPAVRNTYFISNSAFTPSYVSSTHFMGSPYLYTESADPGVAGTKEATIRLGVLKWSANNYSTGYLPVGPNRSADTGIQFFTMSFQRSGISGFNLNIIAPAGVVGLWVAAPGTYIDQTSTLSGWLDATVNYGGSGRPGANSGAGGNGSNGCGVGSLIAANVALSGTYGITLGNVSLTNSTDNVALVRIALATGQTVSTLAVS